MKQAELDYVNNRQIFTAESGRNIIEIKKWKYYNCKWGKYKKMVKLLRLMLV
jgi:hypothetical protein